MANLREVEQFARHMMDAYGLYDWQFKFDTATKRFGVCKYTERTISMSRRLVQANTEAQCVDTVLHEIAHALVGYGHRHGPVWKAKATELGARPEACYTTAEVVAVGKYKAYCAQCGPQALTAQDRRPTRKLMCRKHREPIQWRDQHGHVVDLDTQTWEAVCPVCGPVAKLIRRPNRPMRHNACGNRVKIQQALGIFS